VFYRLLLVQFTGADDEHELNSLVYGITAGTAGDTHSALHLHDRKAKNEQRHEGKKKSSGSESSDGVRDCRLGHRPSIARVEVASVMSRRHVPAMAANEPAINKHRRIPHAR
jgi:hypothetical protein